jgi:Family of unknown function (DUF5995)
MQFLFPQSKLFLLIFPFVNEVCSAQSGNIITNFSSYSFSPGTAKNNTIQQVDSISHSECAANHFSAIYIETMNAIEQKIEPMNKSAQTFIREFEISFANYFLDACYDNRDGKLSPASGWKCFFTHAHFQPWQLIIFGANAHINTDMWQALVNNFSEDEIRQNKKQLLSVQSAIAKVYHPFFEQVMDQSSYLRFMNSFTKGFAKFYAKELIYKWRRRNVHLAILFYHNPQKFKRKLAIVKRKKQRIDEIVLRTKPF